MSIRDEIRKACEDKLLYFVPLGMGGKPSRKVFASPDVWRVIENPWGGDDEDSIRLANMRAGIDHFSHGKRITFATKPHAKDRESFLAPVDPVSSHCWDMRFLAPHSNIRALGFFAEFNCFVALTWDFRENFEGEADWAAGIAKCRQLWSERFTLEPHKGKQASECISKPFNVG